MTSLNIHNSLTYASPMSITDGNIQFVSYKPSGAQSFSPGETINVILSSNTDFLVLDRSYVKFTLTTSAVGTLNPFGASACFNSVQDQVSGLSIPVSRNWNMQRSVQLSTDCSERKTVTASCEQFTGTGTGVATSVSGSFTICMPLPTSVVTDKLWPLALYNAGHIITYGLSNAATVVSAGTYTISNFEVVAALITPEPSYLEELSKGVAGGASLKIPVQLYKSITSTLSSSNN
jgi:hypothetical protein